MKKTKILAAAVLVVFTACACSVIRYETEQTAGSEVYFGGRLSSRIHKPIGEVFHAAIGAYRHFGIAVTKSVSDQLSGVVEGKLSTGDRAETKLSSARAGETVVSIKIGNDGDYAISLRVLKQIKHGLRSGDQ